MGDTGVVRFPGILDPRAQEFRPRNSPNLIPQIPLFGPPPPPPHQVFFPPYASAEAVPFSDGGAVGYYQCASSPAPYVLTAPHLPPESAAPTRTLVLSSVPCDSSESLIWRELEVFGEVRGVQMERVRDGIVTVHFYDLRHAEKALKEIREQHMLHQTRLHNLFASLAPPPPAPPAPGLIACCPMWAQFIIPPCTAVLDGHNQGTIVVFNLDPTVSTNYLREIFQAYGEVKEVRETPLKKQQRFVEFYDVRDAAKALGEMNGKEIQGKQVVIEFSRPGGHGRRFFNAGAAIRSSSPVITSTNNHQRKFFKYGPPHSPPPPPPLPRNRFSSCLSSNIPPSTETQSPIDPNTKGNPNQNSHGKNLIEAVGDGVSEMAADRMPSKRIIKSKGQGNQFTSPASKQQQSRSRPWKSKQAKKLDTRFLINVDAMVESDCSDSRTTVMIKNIPNKYSQKLLLNMLDNHCIHCNEQIGDDDDQPFSSYDFVYLPIDFNNKCNVGYGFVNMTSPQATWRLYKAFHHQHWEVFNSRKICEVTYARVQGLEALKEHFKNSKFPCEMDHYLPVVFSPPRDGRQLTEPLPIVSHKHQLQLEKPIINGLPNIKSTTDDNGDGLKNSTDDDGDDVGQEKENQINFSSCCLNQNGGNIIGDDDKNRSGGSSIVA